MHPWWVEYLLLPFQHVEPTIRAQSFPSSLTGPTILCLGHTPTLKKGRLSPHLDGEVLVLDLAVIDRRYTLPVNGDEVVA